MGATNDQIYSELMKLNKSVGGIEQSVKDTHGFTIAVNAKADRIQTSLTEHVNAIGAHGVAVAEKAAGGTRDNFVAWASLLIATVAAFVPLAIEYLKK